MSEELQPRPRPQRAPAPIDSRAAVDEYRPWLLNLSKFVVRSWLRLFHRFTVHHHERVPTSGPVIIAPNHTSYYDPMCATCSLRRPLRYLAGARLFKNRLFGLFLASVGAVPVDLSKDADRAAYEAALKLLREGEVVCLFPEGTRSLDGRLKPLKGGVARLAMSTGAPIVPVHISGPAQSFPPHQRIPRLFVPFTVTFLEPIYPRPATTGPDRRAEGERLMALLEAALRRAVGDPPPSSGSPSTPARALD
jgi:1-acyl-sn-glycerol-3-phosphate acyltransferase